MRLFPEIVIEHLKFHAALRMKRSLGSAKKRERIDQVLNEFNLEKCQDTKIGITGQTGISGGQKRRLAVATEVCFFSQESLFKKQKIFKILTDPSILFCDEPTSGLDGFMAKSLIKCFKKMASNGKSIICTIHQPSSEIFDLFNT